MCRPPSAELAPTGCPTLPPSWSGGRSAVPWLEDLDLRRAPHLTPPRARPAEEPAHSPGDERRHEREAEEQPEGNAGSDLQHEAERAQSGQEQNEDQQQQESHGNLSTNQVYVPQGNE